jgi:benzil reductase ((S)-benzoin forming)
MNYYFITGTSSGIGEALVQELLRYPQHHIFGLSRTNHLQDDAFTHSIIDLSRPEALEAFTFEKLSDAQQIVLVNNAGTLGAVQYVGQQSNENIQNSIQVNFISAALLMNKFISAYQNVDCQKLIINISSGAAISAYDGWSNYCSAKAALNMFTEVIDKEQKSMEHPIQSFAIAPGVVDTLMQNRIRESSAEQFSQIEKFKSLKSNEQLYQAKDVAKELVRLMQNSENIPSVISRISL